MKFESWPLLPFPFGMDEAEDESSRILSGIFGTSMLSAEEVRKLRLELGGVISSVALLWIPLSVGKEREGDDASWRATSCPDGSIKRGEEERALS